MGFGIGLASNHCPEFYRTYPPLQESLANLLWESTPLHSPRMHPGRTRRHPRAATRTWWEVEPCLENFERNFGESRDEIDLFSSRSLHLSRFHTTYDILRVGKRNDGRDVGKRGGVRWFGDAPAQASFVLRYHIVQTRDLHVVQRKVSVCERSLRVGKGVGIVILARGTQIEI